MRFPEISRFSTLFGLDLNNDILTLFCCIVLLDFVHVCALPYYHKCDPDPLKKNAKKYILLLAYCFFVYICCINQHINDMKKETKNELINMTLCVATTLALVAFCIINLFLFNQ